MVQLHSELRGEVKRVESFPPRRGVGGVYIVGLDFPRSSSGSRISGEAKATTAVVEFGLDEREAAIEGIILIDLMTEVGSKETGPMRSVSSQVGGESIISGFPCLLQYDCRSL